MQLEEARGNLTLGIDHATLAYAIVRIGESFLYADVIADNDPDVDQAVAVIGRLLREG
jgi:Tetracyclin repressor-like, C-terminal domain